MITAYFPVYIFLNIEKCMIDLPPSDLDCCKTSHSAFICQKSLRITGDIFGSLKNTEALRHIPRGQLKVS